MSNIKKDVAPDAEENLLDKDKQDSDESQQSEDEDDLDDEDYDSSLKDDILRPASTRSKIVVNLKEPQSDPSSGGRRKTFEKSDKYEYELDPYDQVRMKLIFDGQKLYNAYQITINEL